jgi:hypothetical protein
MQKKRVYSSTVVMYSTGQPVQGAKGQHDDDTAEAGVCEKSEKQKKVTNFSYPCSVDPGEGPQK